MGDDVQNLHKISRAPDKPLKPKTLKFDYMAITGASFQ